MARRWWLSAGCAGLALALCGLTGCVSDTGRAPGGESLDRVATDSASAATDPTAIDVEAHRGGRDRWPENTLSAFRWAMEIGVDTLEADLAITADGVVVISHNPYLSARLARDADGTYVSEDPRIFIKDLTFLQLQTYDVGELNPATTYATTHREQTSVPGARIPALSELFALAGSVDPDVRYNLEIKTYPPHPEYTIDYREFVRIVLQTIDGSGMRDQVSIQSFDWRTLDVVRDLAPEIPIVCLAVQGFSLAGDPYNLQKGTVGPSPWLAGLDADDYQSVPHLVAAFGADVYSPYYREMNRRDIEEAHALGLAVIPWTVNRPDTMMRLLDDGVDGIITDKPDILLNLLGR